MLFGQKWHRIVPREYEANVRFRRELRALLRKSAPGRRAVWLACRDDFLFFVNAFCWQFNPKKKSGDEIGPFLTFPAQEVAAEKIVWCIENDEDVLIEKSRQMGGSWLMILVFTWLFLFHRNKTLLFISRSRELVDSDSSMSLFYKIDFVLRHLPAYLRPKKVKRKLFFFGNDDLNSSIYGEASTGKAGVGGTLTSMAIDEYSQIREDIEVNRRTSDTTGSRVFNGTHLGLGTEFYRMSRRPDMRKIVLHWSDHPDYARGLYQYDPRNPTSPKILDKSYAFPDGYKFVLDGTPKGGPRPGVRSVWYDKQVPRKGSDSRAVAMDLDIDPEGSTSQFFNTTLVRELVERDAREPDDAAELDHDTRTGKPDRLVLTPSGRWKLWVQVDVRSRLPRARYAVGCDIATGTGATPSCASVIDADRGLKVMEYSNPHVKPDKFAALVAAMCWWLEDHDGGPAFLVWEAAGPTGELFAKTILEVGFRNIWYYRDEFVLNPTISDKPGWYPGGGQKITLLRGYENALDSGRLVNPSKSALLETGKFQYDATGRDVVHGESINTDDPSGARANHGDMVIADALSWMAAKEISRKQADHAKSGRVEYPVGSMGWRQAQEARTERVRRANDYWRA